MVLFIIFINIFIITTINNCIINKSMYNIIYVFLSIGYRLSSDISIFLATIQMLFFICILIFVSLYARRCLKKACILYALVIHFTWFIGNVLSMIEIETFKDSNFCVFWTIDSIHQLSFPLVLFDILQRPSQYWRQLKRLVMQTNIPRKSIWDRTVNTGQSSEQVFGVYRSSNNNTNTTNNYSNNKTLYEHQSNQITFDQGNDAISMRVAVFDFARLSLNNCDKNKKNLSSTTHGRDDSNAPNMDDGGSIYLCIGTSAAVR